MGCKTVSSNIYPLPDVSLNVNIEIMKILTLILLLAVSSAFSQQRGNVSVGDEAIDFKLENLQGDEIHLAELNKKGPVVLIILRGWPGYQCPICTRQVGGLVAEAEGLAEHEAQVLLIYPGPSKRLKEHANEFFGEFNLPEHFYFVTDPDYSVINSYGLRWDAPKETAYPSTFVIDQSGEIVFVRISETHGGRAEAKEILAALKKTN